MNQNELWMEELFEQTPYRQTTLELEVRVCPFYVPKQSRPEVPLHVYIYFVRMINHSASKTLELKSRKWVIKDATRHEEVVTGPGVVGQFPVINPGNMFTYSSFCPLKTLTGNMRGEYYFVDTLSPQNILQIKIPLFFLRPDQSIEEHSQEIFSPPQNLH